MRKNVIFDLDGTLIDSKSGIISSAISAFAALGLPPPRSEQIEIGPPIRNTLLKLLNSKDAELNDSLIKTYQKLYREKGVHECQLYDGIYECLEHLAQTKRLYIATTKAEPFAHQICDTLKISSFFQRIYGSGLDGSLSDKSDLLKYLLTDSQLEPLNCIMIGDRSHDIEAANSHQMIAIGVGWGYGSKSELLNSDCDHYLETVEELISLLQGT